MFTRTLQTLAHRTQKVHEFRVEGLNQDFQLRALEGRVKRPHFILVLASSMHRKHLWEDIKVVSEVSVRYGRPYFNISISSQYPEFADSVDEIQEKVESYLLTHSYIQQKSTA